MDAIGSQSSVPTVAAHLSAPWERVIVIPGSSHVQRHSEDTGLVLTIAERLRSGEDEPRLVIADEERQMAKHHEMKAEYEFVTASLPGDALVDRLRPSDLVVVPSHTFSSRCLSRAVSGFRTDWPTKTSGRLSVAPRSLPHAMQRILGPTR